MKHRTLLLVGIATALALTACGGGAEPVPDVVGLSFDGARGQLEEHGFRVTREDVEDEDTPEGEVVSQAPAAGEPLEDPTERVTLAVAAPFQADISGTITLKDIIRRDEGEPCSGTGGYKDMRSGAQVTVSNQSGEVIAVGRIGKGKAVETPTAIGKAAYCEFPLSVTGVPDAEIYTIEVSHRGGLSYTREEMEDMGWEVALTLG